MTQTTNKYPQNITYESVFAIYTVSQNMKQDKQYLENAPYSEAVKKSLRIMFSQQPSEVISEEKFKPSNIEISELDLKTETSYLYQEAKSLLKSNVLDEKDRAAVIKTMTSQMEKLIALVERAENINQMRDFETRVLKVMKKVLPEKREEFLAELARLENNND